MKKAILVPLTILLASMIACSSYFIKPAQAAVHDAAILSAHAYPDQVTEGTIVTVDVVVENQGTQHDEILLSWCLYIGVPPLVLHIGGGSGDKQCSLDAGENETVTFYWNTSGLSPDNYGRVCNVTFVDPGIVDDDPSDNLKYTNVVEVYGGVGGVAVPVDKFGLLAPYIALTSIIVATTVATAIYVKRVKRRKKKQ